MKTFFQWHFPIGPTTFQLYLSKKCYTVYTMYSGHTYHTSRTEMMDWVDKIRENLDLKTAQSLRVQVCFLETLYIVIVC